MTSPSIVHVTECADPVRAFGDAHLHGSLLAVRTSGTATHPRTIVRTPESWVRSFPHVSALLGIDSSSRVWVPGPVTATMNLFAAVHTDWAGATRVDNPREATHAHLTPSALRQVLHRTPDALAGVHAVTAGDRLEATTYGEAAAVGAQVSHYYGAAELSFVAWGAHADALHTFPGVEVTSRDGELWVRSPYVCDGYLEPEHTLRHDDDGWVTVGDRGAVDGGTATPAVRVHGRGGGITTGGATVLAADIEQVLRTVASGDVVVVGVPHPDLGQVVAAVHTCLDEVAALKTCARERLSPAQQPRRWQHLHALPLTAAGKIDRDAVVAALLTSRRNP